MFIYINNRIYNKNKANISIFDRSFLYGENIFETILKRDGIIINLELHLNRFNETIDRMNFGNNIVFEDIKKKILILSKKNGLNNSSIKIMLTGGKSARGLYTKERMNQKIIIIEEKLNFNKKKYIDGIEISEVEKKNSYNNINIKAGGLYLNSILKLNEVNQKDILFIDEDENILETTISNIFFIKNNIIHTPTNDLPILFGITAQIIKKICIENGIKFLEGRYTLKDIEQADEIFICNSLIGILPIKKLKNVNYYYFAFTAKLSHIYWNRYGLKNLIK